VEAMIKVDLRFRPAIRLPAKLIAALLNLFKR
jgi:hypothetical protein